MDRRNFIKSGCILCVGAVGLGILATGLSSCATLPMYNASAEKDFLNVPLSAFNKSRILIVRNKQSEYDILLVKNSETDIRALLMKCTHQDNSLTANTSGLFCASHGSTFDLKGEVTKEPALRALKKFKTNINGNQIIINLKS